MGGGYPKDMDPESQSFADVVGAHTDVYVQAAQTHHANYLSTLSGSYMRS
eukprot:CAMPEP_0185758912 /NCGR_PEP_ID=MMETSP1174-20130828/17611_1 /TAXON_ID=35687 /ORGANISM="Dictyocha speculum, Strain CCMP1381" /LENGTH=49 /DNA_ID=CAMNT_0028438989 /DNA_START=599 /DNA_END=748 /DNA_ORIENTATION=+